MAVLTQYNFTQQVDYSTALTEKINQSSIVTALDHIETVGAGPTMNVDVWFKDVLSGDDETTLNSLMSGYTNPPVPTPSNVVTTQYELNDKDLKLAKTAAAVDPETGIATFRIRVPGDFGTGAGRYIAGGYGITEDYERDDYSIIYGSDDDRILCSLLGLPTDGSGDTIIQGMGVLPGPLSAFGALPLYPTVKTYYDDECPTENQGWHFDPISMGTADPVGYLEVEPIAGYAYIPSGLYLKGQYIRPNKTTGGIRVDLFWGKKG